MKTYIVEARRCESIYFRIRAAGREDAESRYLMDGDEIGSTSAAEPEVVSVTPESEE